jgi:hypothetical protein
MRRSDRCFSPMDRLNGPQGGTGPAQRAGRSGPGRPAAPALPGPAIGAAGPPECLAAAPAVEAAGMEACRMVQGGGWGGGAGRPLWDRGVGCGESRG